MTDKCYHFPYPEYGVQNTEPVHTEPGNNSPAEVVNLDG